MACEIEHKYLVNNTLYRDMAVKSVLIFQGYLSRNPDCVVRIRIAGESAFLTIKGRNYSSGADSGLCDTRPEFEYPIPVHDAKAMLKMAEGSIIEKIRYIVPFEGFFWEVDEFQGSHEGLTTAEIELSYSGQIYSLPPFAGENVTGNPKYYNSNL